MGETFTLSGKTKIDELTKRYPFLIDYLPSLSPKYSKLKSPFIRRTMGAIATMEKVANMGDLELDYLLNALAGEIERRTGERVALEGVVPAVPAPASDEERKEAMKSIIRDIHAGEDPELLKDRFADLIADISPGELAEVEQSLIDDGLPEEEVKRMCSLHVEVFKEGLDKGDVPSMPGGHPVHTYMMENRAAENILADIDGAMCDLGDPPDEAAFAAQQTILLDHLDTLSELDKHYLRKENQLFPMLEDHGITGPSQVMWATHDDIRAEMKEAVARTQEGDARASVERITAVSDAVKDMVYKEENILYPMCLENFSEAEWSRVRTGEEEIGYAWIMPSTGWEPQAAAEEPAAAPGAPAAVGAELALDNGRLTVQQVNLLLKHLPVDITFVADDDTVAYYSDTDDRIFPRSQGIIGRQVSKCHPPKSVHIVERIVQAFRDGEKDSAEFWVDVKGRLVHIRYFAVRDEGGAYRGTMEVSQDISDIKRLDGERRLLDWS
jgi:DUF438 domain-containing protein